MIWPLISGVQVESRTRSLLFPLSPLEQVFLVSCCEEVTRKMNSFSVLQDTFASKVAAQNDKYADSSIGNVTGSNAVNVFLGIGIAWTLAAIVKWFRGEQFIIDPGSLSYSVTIFCISACVCCLVLMVRRRFGGELGGPGVTKWMTSIFLFSLWLFYLLMSCLETYGIVSGF